MLSAVSGFRVQPTQCLRSFEVRKRSERAWMRISEVPSWMTRIKMFDTYRVSRKLWLLLKIPVATNDHIGVFAFLLFQCCCQRPRGRCQLSLPTGKCLHWFAFFRKRNFQNPIGFPFEFYFSKKMAEILHRLSIHSLTMLHLKEP